MKEYQTQDDLRSNLTNGVLVFLFICVDFLGIVGNSLICLALWTNKRLRTATNLLVLALCIADLMIACVKKPAIIPVLIYRDWIYDYTSSQFFGIIVHLWAAVSINTMNLTAINRFMCVTKPQRYKILFTKRNTLIAVLIVWVATIGFGALICHGAPITFKYDPPSCYCIPTYHNQSTKRLITIAFLLLFLLSPTAIFIFCYAKVFSAVKRHNAAVAPTLKGGSGNESLVSAEELRMTRLLFITVVTFTLCWLPLNLVVFLRDILQVSVPDFAATLYAITALSSILINPIVYGVMNRAMRKEFISLLCRKT